MGAEVGAAGALNSRVWTRRISGAMRAFMMRPQKVVIVEVIELDTVRSATQVEEPCVKSRDQRLAAQ